MNNSYLNPMSESLLYNWTFIYCVCKGEDEAMFVEYRKQLKMLLDRLAQVSPELLLESVHRVFTSTMQ